MCTVFLFYVCYLTCPIYVVFHLFSGTISFCLFPPSSNDGLPTCDASCWKRTNYLDSEWSCYRNHMDTRCPAMLQGPCRRQRGIQYMKYLEKIYHRPTHQLHIIPDIGHDATGMFGSDIGLQVIFGQSL